ncbi:MAG: TetR/AcrR family transcriptional regulator [Clostridiaceae bacterium]
MKQDKANTKAKIYQATLELLASGEDASQISTRQIAAKAGVNLALVNYYYQSKENLLSEVVGNMMGKIISQIIEDDSSPGDAESRLKDILISTMDVAFMHENICKIAIMTELKRGCSNSCAMVTPFLTEMFKGYSKADLDIIALQLMLPFHHIFLEPELYGRLLDTDFFNKQKRDQKINQMIECVLAGLSKGNKEG